MKSWWGLSISRAREGAGSKWVMSTVRLLVLPCCSGLAWLLTASGPGPHQTLWVLGPTNTTNYQHCSSLIVTEVTTSRGFSLITTSSDVGFPQRTLSCQRGLTEERAEYHCTNLALSVCRCCRDWMYCSRSGEELYPCVGSSHAVSCSWRPDCGTTELWPAGLPCQSPPRAVPATCPARHGASTWQYLTVPDSTWQYLTHTSHGHHLTVTRSTADYLEDGGRS